MQIGIFGTGVVGTTIGSKLIALGHAVKLGARAATNDVCGMPGTQPAPDGLA